MYPGEFNQVFDQMPPRRKEVLLKVLAGETDKEISQALNIAETTVRKHVEQLCNSFKIENEFPDERRSKRPDLIALFARHKPDLVIERKSQSTSAQFSEPLSPSASLQVVKEPVPNRASTTATFTQPAPFSEGSNLNADSTNPYDPWTPVTPPRFLGRSTLLRRLEAALGEGRSISLVGDWRMGKSSILETWEGLIQQQGRVVKRVTSEDSAGVSQSALVQTITGQPVDSDGDDPDEAANVLSKWVDANSPSGIPPLILIDEFDALIPRFQHRFFERLRGMLGRIALVLVSRQELDRVYSAKQDGRTSPFANRLELHRLGLLEAAAATEIVQWGKPFVGTAQLDEMSEWAGRHPFYLQLLGRHLVDAQLYGRSMDEAIDYFWIEASARLRELWQILGEREQEVLRQNLTGNNIVPIQRPRSLRLRGLVDESGQPFGRVLVEWLQEEQA